MKDTFSDFEKAVLRFKETNFNQKIPGSNWSPAMVAQHLILAGTGIDQILLGNTATTENEADAKVGQLKDIFLDFTTKFTSPEFIEPVDQDYLVQLQQEKLNSLG